MTLPDGAEAKTPLPPLVRLSWRCSIAVPYPEPELPPEATGS